METVAEASPITTVTSCWSISAGLATWEKPWKIAFCLAWPCIYLLAQAPSPGIGIVAPTWGDSRATSQQTVPPRSDASTRRRQRPDLTLAALTDFLAADSADHPPQHRFKVSSASGRRWHRVK